MDGTETALTALYKWANHYDPAKQSYSLRAKEWRYIRYSNGKEELYQTVKDPHEWENIVHDSTHRPQLESFRKELLAMIPSRPKPKPTVTDAELWKANYFRKFPQADANSDGKLTGRNYRSTGKNLGLPLLQTPHPANVPKSNRKNPKA